jgi:hypothetical protein
MVLIVKFGENGSSSIYNAFNDGEAIINKINTGRIVQIISIIWF